MASDEAAYALGIDLGGTAIKFGLIDRQGCVVARASRPTAAEKGPEQGIETIAAGVEEVLQARGVSRGEIVGAGLGAPGPAAYSKGRLGNPGNLPGWRGFGLRDRLAERLGMGVAFGNDANMAALGEHWVGAGRGVGSLVLFTLGTGVGSGVILGGQVFGGHNENGGELGHLIVEMEGRKCACGQRGCVEAYASASAAAAMATEALAAGESGSVLKGVLKEKGRIASEDVVEAVRAGDVLATGVWERVCRALGAACVGVQHAFNVELVLLGGGMAGAGACLLECVRKHLEELTWELVSDQPRVELAALGNDAGIIGAGRAAFGKKLSAVG